MSSKSTERSVFQRIKNTHQDWNFAKIKVVTQYVLNSHSYKSSDHNSKELDEFLLSFTINGR
jgi:hypothetical protein